MIDQEHREAWDVVLYEGETLSEDITGTWRWGNTNRRVYRLDGKTWAVEYRTQTDEGVEECGPPQPYEVEQCEKTVTVWVPIDQVPTTLAFPTTLKQFRKLCVSKDVVYMHTEQWWDAGDKHRMTVYTYTDKYKNTVECGPGDFQDVLNEASSAVHSW